MSEYKISQIDKDALVNSWNNMTKSNADVVREMGAAMAVDTTADSSEASAVWRCIKKKISSSAVIQGLLTVDREGGVTGTHTAKAGNTSAAPTTTPTTTTATTADTPTAAAAPTAETLKFKVKIKGTGYSVEAVDNNDAVTKLQQLLKNNGMQKGILQEIKNGKSTGAMNPMDIKNGGEYEVTQQLTAA